MTSRECSSSPATEVCEMSFVDSEDEDSGTWDDWTSTGLHVDAEDADNLQCLFCIEKRRTAASVFAHCVEQHSFDFVKLRRERQLEFYECLRLINFIRSEVAANGSGHALEVVLQHLKVVEHVESSRSSFGGEGESADSIVIQGFFGALWSDDKFLTPFMANDSLLYSFDDGENDGLEDFDSVDDKNTGAECLRDHTQNYGGRAVTIRAQELAASQLSEDLREVILATGPGIAAHASSLLAEAMCTEAAPNFEDEHLNDEEMHLDHMAGETNDKTNESRDIGAEMPLKKENKSKVTFATVADKEKLSINRSYFGSYSGFGIHREMLGDKVRTEAYQAAIVENPSLLKDSVVMDVGCGTGILSLFAAKAGARSVIAVDGSEKMTAVATQVAKTNGFLAKSSGKGQSTKSGVITVVAGMVEELDLAMPVQENSVDVLISEWMGYCLLFESMLGSVLYARDKWLKPGGAMLPDTASMYVAGFGKGGTSLSFWENVYGFDMQCVGEEVVHDATQHPIIDVIPSKDVITDSCLLKEFDLTSMKHDDVDYTADFHIKLHPSALVNSTEKRNSDGDSEQNVSSVKHGELPGKSNGVKCYGLVLWFDTGFTSRFCRENPVNLTTSPHAPKTHWSQTLLTFKEAISLCTEGNLGRHHNIDRSRVGSDEFPAYSVSGRISIARSFRYRSIDISLETTALGAGGAVRSWPVQMFDI